MVQLQEELSGQTPERDTWLAVGVFDGVHLGHRHLLGQLQELARQAGMRSGVVTFKQHPRRVLPHSTGLRYLVCLEERLRLLRSLGLDLVIALSFTPELAQLSARDFLRQLQKHLRLKGLVVGPDFALGRGREGNVAALRQLSQEMGFALRVVPPLVLEGQVVSSTAIRQALQQGDMGVVNRLLGRPFQVMGPVVAGDTRGRALGFPTANIGADEDCALPADGVYVTRARWEDHSGDAVTNIGQRPTFGGGKKTVEVFLLDFSGDLYGQELRIELLHRLRGEKHFSSAEELQRQIQEDVRQARALLQEVGKARNYG